METKQSFFPHYEGRPKFISVFLLFSKPEWAWEVLFPSGLWSLHSVVNKNTAHSQELGNYLWWRYIRFVTEDSYSLLCCDYQMVSNFWFSGSQFWCLFKFASMQYNATMSTPYHKHWPLTFCSCVGQSRQNTCHIQG